MGHTSRYFYRLLVHECDIQTWTNSGDDEFGQPTQVWGDLVSGQACRLRTEETGRPFEARNPRTGETVRAEFQVFFPLVDGDTWDATNERPNFDEQAKLVFTAPYNLTLNVELVAERASKRQSHHLETYCNRAKP